MVHLDHHAILVAINYYPGLVNLDGPENDVAAFSAWLVRPDGGNMTPNNVRTIRSSDFPVVLDVNDANPTERAFIRELDRLMRKPDDRSWLNRVGSRLYLYMAGHGFTAGPSLSDAALFTAVAQSGDTAHIAGYQYAAKIVNAGFFDEVVLIMDCCQDVLKASRVLEPTWSPPDRNRSSQVKFFQAYGAPRGQAAFETPDSEGKQTRGVFSRVLMESLEMAKPDASGHVTGLGLKNHFLQIWGDEYRKRYGYDPPIRVPDGLDIQILPRSLEGVSKGSGRPVNFSVTPPVPQDGNLNILRGPSELVLSLKTDQLAPQVLPPGLYKALLEGTTRSTFFEVTGIDDVEVRL